ncbi:tRNA modification GTPase MnmE [Candidatus Johnevansia muelleri]|uniref:tRNA modification GTPase MnmE n=1 Tax=Candidatus Johnevansia muelleri TaxID=1495769 RepID=A0A078KEA8_9GAMM|nr:tRNA modification GTPase MnmE [Candidatus Evansia muelleri]
MYHKLFTKIKDTITAQSTPSGRGGIGIVRVSGNKVKSIAKGILGFQPKPRYAHYGSFIGNKYEIIDEGIALFFLKPHSLTGEDILEIQSHGGPIIIDYIIERTINLGARLARPGEFLERAFINNKIDLIKAEGINDLIEANSRIAAQNAIYCIQGNLSNILNTLIKEFIKLRINLEYAINFPDENIDFLKYNIFKKFSFLKKNLSNLLNKSTQNLKIREGINVVIIGQPNVGKSSLLNALTEKESAIVTDIAGTTRDVIHEYIYIHGIQINLIDTAGLCETLNTVEKIGIKRAWTEIKKADHILLVIDASKAININLNHPSIKILLNLPDLNKITIIYNKIDLINPQINEYLSSSIPTIIPLSTKNGVGIEKLKIHLKKIMKLNTIYGKFYTNRRHINVIENALKILEKNKIKKIDYIELLAEDLRYAQNIISTITGEFTSENLLNEIFNNFCIGK